MEYILKACGVLAIFYVFYLVLLRKDTFFKSNRAFLLLGLVFTFLLSAIVIPIYIEYTPVAISNFTFEAAEATQTKLSFSILDYLVLAYILGVIFFLVRFVLQLVSLVRIINGNAQKHTERFVYVETQKNIAPFSFFKWIVYNPDHFNPEELEQILAHERVHAAQRHSFDVLIMQLVCILLWFNPLVWLYAKSLKQNLEFLADNEAITDTQCKKTYQYTLLKTCLPTHQLALSNNFYNSLIKKRIVMLHKSKSRTSNQLKFLLITPLLVLFLMSFGTKKVYVEKEITPVYNLQPETKLPLDAIAEQKNTVSNEAMGPESQKENISREKDPKKSNRTTKATNVSNNIYAKATTTLKTFGISKSDEETIIITKNTSDDALESIVKTQKKHGLDLKFSGVKRNSDGEITAIKIEASCKKSNANYSIKNDDPIKPIMITYNSKGNISIGNAKSSGNTFAFETDSDTDKTVTVVVESDEESDDNIEEDIIVIKEKSNGRHDKTIIKSEENSKIIIETDDNAKPLFVVDGKVLKKAKFKNLDPDDIEKINVIKGENAIKKYGGKAKDGVVEVITKKKK